MCYLAGVKERRQPIFPKVIEVFWARLTYKKLVSGLLACKCVGSWNELNLVLLNRKKKQLGLMALNRSMIVLVCIAAAVLAWTNALFIKGAEARADLYGAEETVGSAHATHGLPKAPPVLFRVGPLPVTNSMVVSWVVAVGLIVFARLATRQMQEVPGGLQNFWEWLVEILHDFLEGLIGRDLVRRTFWFFASIFIFILFADWAGLLPGVGTIGWGTKTAHGFVVERPLFRGANADLNMTFAMATVFFVCWTIWALQVNGLKGFLLHIFGPKGDTTGLLRVMLIGMFVFVGLLEVISILFRPVSLSFRLYGNIYAGENLLEAVTAVAPAPFSWLLPVPFYLLELMVGVIQALVFMLLTAVFTMLICTHEQAEQAEE